MILWHIPGGDGCGKTGLTGVTTGLWTIITGRWV